MSDHHVPSVPPTAYALPAQTPEELDYGSELSDEDLEHVVGGLARLFLDPAQLPQLPELAALEAQLRRPGHGLVS